MPDPFPPTHAAAAAKKPSGKAVAQRLTNVQEKDKSGYRVLGYRMPIWSNEEEQ